MSAVIRSLLVGIGFRVNRQSMTQANTSILGVRAGLGLAATAAIVAANRVQRFFSDVVQSTIATDQLARSLGLARRQIDGIQTAGTEFGLTREDSLKSLEKLNELLRDTRRGGGELYKLSRRINFNFDPKGNANQLLQDILISLSQISDEETRIEAASEIFGKNLGVAFSDISQNIDKFNSSANKAANNSLLTGNSVKVAQEYKVAIEELSRTWEQFASSLTVLVFPVLNKLLKILNLIVSGYTQLFTSISRSLPSFLTGSSSNGRTLTDNSNRGINVNNEMVVNINTGTTREQANTVAQEFASTVGDIIFDVFQTIGYQNPDIE